MIEDIIFYSIFSIQRIVCMVTITLPFIRRYCSVIFFKKIWYLICYFYILICFVSVLI